jgi:restriction endonuclease S subunit
LTFSRKTAEYTSRKEVEHLLLNYTTTNTKMQYSELDNLAQIRSGYPFRGSVRHDPAGDIRVLQIRDLRQSKTLTAEALSQVMTPDNHSAHLLKPDDIVMPARGDHRKAVPFTLAEPTIPSSHLHTVRVISSNVLPGYLCWALNQPEPQHAMKNEARGTAMPLLTRRSLSTIKIPVPTLTTQRRIVELHELWQREQALTQQLLTNREHMLKGMFQALMHDGDTE